MDESPDNDIPSASSDPGYRDDPALAGLAAVAAAALTYCLHNRIFLFQLQFECTAEPRRLYREWHRQLAELAWELDSELGRSFSRAIEPRDLYRAIGRDLEVVAPGGYNEATVDQAVNETVVRIIDSAAFHLGILGVNPAVLSFDLDRARVLSRHLSYLGGELKVADDTELAVAARAAIDRLLAGSDQPSSLPEGLAPAGPGSLAPAGEILQHVVEVASYIGTAGLGGVIGARADAALMTAVKRLHRRRNRRKRQAGWLFRRTHDRWQRRAAQANDPLSKGEAVDAARAAALTRGYALADLAIAGTQQESDGSWRVMLTAAGDNLRVLVPPGDPSHAKILIMGSR